MTLSSSCIMLVPKTYPVLVRAIEEGVREGYGRAFKHSDCPEEVQILECISDSVILTIAEWFDIDDE